MGPARPPDAREGRRVEESDAAQALLEVPALPNSASNASLGAGSRSRLRAFGAGGLGVIVLAAGAAVAAVQWRYRPNVLGSKGSHGGRFFESESQWCHMIASGKCEDAGLSPIVHKDTCEKAAKALGLSDTTAERTDNAPRPEGCFYQVNVVGHRGGGVVQADESLLLSTNETNKGKGCETSDIELYSQICISLPHTTSTSTSTVTTTSSSTSTTTTQTTSTRTRTRTSTTTTTSTLTATNVSETITEVSSTTTNTTQTSVTHVTTQTNTTQTSTTSVSATSTSFTTSVTTSTKGVVGVTAWVGCFEYDMSNFQQFLENFLLPGKPDSKVDSTTICSGRCYQHEYIAMHDEGVCLCMRKAPSLPQFGLAADTRCGSICHGERYMLPERFCGTSSTFAVYRVGEVSSSLATDPSVVALSNISQTVDFSNVSESSVESEEAEVRKALAHLEALPNSTSSKSHGSSASNHAGSIDATKSNSSNTSHDVQSANASHEKHNHSGDGTTPEHVRHARPKTLMKSICYAPVPIKNKSRFDNDDFMSMNASALWGRHGRNDLRIIKELGANTVRLYGNDISVDHTRFLDEALDLGLSVIVGISDYPYTQMKGNCVSTKLNCYKQIKDSYTSNLKNGFLLPNKSYHPALSTIVIMNEPDLKLLPTMQPKSFGRGLISALDALLDAEAEAGVVGTRPNLTATFSFGMCKACKHFANKPAVAQMLELRDAVRKPASYGYKPRNNLEAAYEERFVNSVNTANPTKDLRRLFLDSYDAHFQGVPVFLGEYHSPKVAEQAADLEEALKVAADPSTMLIGLSFFEFQVRYDKGGSEMDFGMFELGDENLGKVTIGSAAHTSWCLQPHSGAPGQRPLPAAVAKAYGGRSPHHPKAAGACPEGSSFPTSLS